MLWSEKRKRLLDLQSCALQMMVYIFYLFGTRLDTENIP